MVIWLEIIIIIIIIISQKQLAEVVSGIDIISFANKNIVFTSFRA